MPVYHTHLRELERAEKLYRDWPRFSSRRVIRCNSEIGDQLRALPDSADEQLDIGIAREQAKSAQSDARRLLRQFAPPEGKRQQRG